jgi:3-oxoacyl-[acyl-carrier-protein] synthase-1
MDLVISGLGVCCPSGVVPSALLGAVATNISAAAADERFSLPVSGAEEDAAVLTAPVTQLQELKDPPLRMAMLAQTALVQALAGLPDDFAWGELLIITLVPEAQTPRGLQPHALDQLRRDLSELRPGLDRAGFRFASYEEGAVAHLQAACAELREGKRRALLFGGVDSLVDLVTCTLLARDGRIATTHNSEGLVPGEGAAYVLVQSESASTALAHLAGIGYAVEPHAGQADASRMRGLSAAVASALEARTLLPAAMDCVIAPHDGSLSGALEWHQTVERLFPRRESAPRNFEELLPCRSFGDLGAAALPLALVLGCARFEFTNPSVKHVMVCEPGDFPQRGAVLLVSF